MIGPIVSAECGPDDHNDRECAWGDCACQCHLIENGDTA